MPRVVSCAVAAAMLLAGCAPGALGRTATGTPVPPGANSASTSAVPAARTVAASPLASQPSSVSQTPFGSSLPNAPPPDVVRSVTVSVPPLPAADIPVTLRAVAFASATDGAAVGSRCTASPQRCTGVILATDDGGARWTPVLTTRAALYDVHFLPGGFGWALGANAVYGSTDQGAGWHPLPLPRLAFPMAPQWASFTSPSDGWVAYSGGSCATQGCPFALYQTADGGARWSEVAADALPGSARAPLQWAEYSTGGSFGGGQGWVLMQWALLRTGDDGRTWTTARALDAGGVSGLATFAADGRGWAESDAGQAGGALFGTADRGSTWQALGPVPDVVSLIAALDGSSVWAVVDAPGKGCPPRGCEGVRIAGPKSKSVGHFVPASPDVRLRALAPLDASTAWAVATGPWAGTALLQTVDGGGSWTVGYRTGVVAPSGPWGFWNPTAGWAVGSNTDPSVLLRTSDAGHTWSVVGQVPVQQVVRAGFPSPQAGWVASGNGRLLTTSDGGRDWTPVALPKGVCLQKAGFATPSAGWVTGAAYCGAALLLTADSGQTWRAPASMPPGTVWSVAMSAAGAVWMVLQPPGPHADLYLEHSTGAGQPWHALANLGPDLSPRLRLDPAGGLWLGDLRSADGGRTWTRYILPKGDAGGTMAFVSSRLGWLSAGGGLYRTADGGATWQAQAAYGG